MKVTNPCNRGTSLELNGPFNCAKDFDTKRLNNLFSIESLDKLKMDSNLETWLGFWT